jgi:hypothetical protein
MPKPLANALASHPVRCLAAATLLVAFAGAPNAHAQSTRGATEAPRSEAEQAAELAKVQQAATDLLVRTILKRSRDLPNPTVVDYRVTALGLRLARQMSPGDAELLRREIEAWTAADDAARVMEVTRELIRLDPRDTIAQLRLIDSQIGRLNTVEERRAAYERLLGPAGERLRASIRSRLALDAALLAREDGDDEAFLRRLTDATLLDETNKNAAALYASMLLPIAQTRVERFELIANVLQADPLDPGAYENAAIELMSAGAYEASLRFLDRMRDLLGEAGRDFMSRAYLSDPQRFDEARASDYLIAAWQHRGVAQALSFINDAQGQVEGRFSSEFRQLQEQGASAAQLQEALQQNGFPLLPYQLERKRALMLVGQSEDARQELAFSNRPLQRDQFSTNLNPFDLDGFIEPPAVTDEMLRSVAAEFPDAQANEVGQEASKRARLARDINPLHEAVTRFLLSSRNLMDRLNASEQVEEATKRRFEVNLTLESVWLLLVSELSVDLAEDRFENLLEALNEDALEESAIARYRGWIAANRGDFETARELLTPLAESDASALYALGMTELRSGNIDEAIRRFQQVRVRFPQTALACVSRDRLELLTGSRPGPLPGSDEVNRYALRFAPGLERMTRAAREFMSLSVRPTAGTLGPLDRHELVLEISNTSGRPLAVGPNSPINSQFLFTPRVELNGKAYLDIHRDRLLAEARRRLGVAENAPLPETVRERVDLLVAQEIFATSMRMLEVVDVDRVLRLEPNESVRVPVWGGQGMAGQLLDRDPTERITIAWSVAQGFVQTQRMSTAGWASPAFTSGPMSLNTQVSPVLRVRLPDVSQELLAERLLNSSGEEFVNTLMQASAVMSGVGDPQEAALVRDAMLERVPRLTDLELTYLALRLTELFQLDRDDELRIALRDLSQERLSASDLSDPTTQLLAVASMVSLVRGADAPIVRLSRESSQPDLAEFAAVFAQIFEEAGFAVEPEDPTSELGGNEEQEEPVYEVGEDMFTSPDK